MALLACKAPPAEQGSVSNEDAAVAVGAAIETAVEATEGAVISDQFEEEREREAILQATSLPQPTCEEEPLATYFFTLMGRNSVDNCGQRNPAVIAAFDALIVEAKEAELPDPDIPPLSDRLLSGPSAPGQPYSVDGVTWWYYTACQAHQCNTNFLALLYLPSEQRAVGRLVARCQVWWLGDPDTAQRALIDAIDPVDTEYQDDAASCGLGL